MICRCRNCAKRYNSDGSRADLNGYCSMACQHEKASRLGFKKGKTHLTGYPKSEYEVLNKAGVLGNFPWEGQS